MKERLFLLTLLFGCASSCFPARPFSSTQGSSPQTYLKRNESTLTGCLMMNPYNEYELVDEKGIHTLLYSSTVPLDTYMGQSVTLVGELCAAPSAYTGTARPMPLKVVDLRPAAGKCSKW